MRSLKSRDRSCMIILLNASFQHLIIVFFVAEILNYVFTVLLFFLLQFSIMVGFSCFPVIMEIDMNFIIYWT